MGLYRRHRWVERLAWLGVLVTAVVFVSGVVEMAGRSAPQRVRTGSFVIGLRPFVMVPRWAGPPTDLTAAPGGGSGRVFIAARKGVIFVADETGGLRARPFLDLRAAGVRVLLADEGGLCGLAFGPHYAGVSGRQGVGKFYTFTTEVYDPDARVDFSHPEMKPAGRLTPASQAVVREWAVDPADPERADPASSRVIMRINHPQTQHYGGGLAFGRDGYLYIALGDGGGGNDKLGGRRVAVDGHTDSVGNAQDLSNVFGKILRIDPLGSGAANGEYGIPTDNPFVGRAGAVPEVYALGLRNPYRISFDPATGLLYAGDVGQSQREEIDVIRRGGNYGWASLEGTRDNHRSSGVVLSARQAVSDPVAEYTHRDGMAVIGGFVYRGMAIPTLVGTYVFGDYLGPAPGVAGRLFYTGAGGGDIHELRYETGAGLLGPPPNALMGFGRDRDGELYALFDGGEVARLVGTPAARAAGWTGGPRLSAGTFGGLGRR